MSFLLVVVPGPTLLFVIGRAPAHGGRSPRRLSALGGAGGPAMIGLGLTVAATGRAD